MHEGRKPSQDDPGSGLTFALQALLARHESYVAESQQEHARLDARIAQLEVERTTLQTANERIVAENKELLSKLEILNDSYKVSDNTVKTLEALLRDTEIEVRRLNGLARRAEDLDARVQEMDRQRMELMQKLTDTETESRSTLARWRESERKVKQLELELQKIEWEARMDRDKHDEIVARLERERVLERELGGAEGRLKGAAALQGLESGNGGNVVTHFVRDILQDNANLQAGIVELRELLQTSNDQVQNLRQQVIHHQPIDEEEPDEHFSKSVPLDQELGWNQPSPQQPQREVHVHHHYHAKLASKQNKSPIIRRASRRRTVMGAGAFSSPGSSTPSTPTTRPHRFASSPIIPIHLNQPQPRRNRWSVQSSATMASTISSLPSSPQSYIFDQNSSILDRIEAGDDSSRPTSPESTTGYFSPAAPRSRDAFEPLIEDEDEIFASDAKENIPPGSEPSPKLMSNFPKQELTPKPSQSLSHTQPIDICPPQPLPPDPATPNVSDQEEGATPTTIAHIDSATIETPRRGATEATPSTSNNEPPSISEVESTPISEIEIRPSLHRSSSHDSLVSISGMDIHLAKRPPASTSQPPFRIRGNAAYFPITPAPARKVSASQPMASVTDVSAVSSKRSFSSDTQGPAGRSLQHIAGVPVSPQHKNSTNPGVVAGLGKMVGLGGWVGKKWGVAPTKSIADLRSHISPSPSLVLRAAPPTPPKPIQRPNLTSIGSGSVTGSLSRTPGINQKGSIPGLWIPKQADVYQVRVEPATVDEEGLKEVLAGT